MMSIGHDHALAEETREGAKRTVPNQFFAYVIFDEYTQA